MITRRGYQRHLPGGGHARRERKPIHCATQGKGCLHLIPITYLTEVSDDRLQNDADVIQSLILKGTKCLIDQ